MKAAMWGVGLVVLGLFGLVMVNLFGNITVTNQFNYTTMKNSVKAAMLDSLDIPHYRAGFCLCTADGSPINKGTLRSFSDKNDYEFRDIVDDKCGEEDSNSCVALYGEYRLISSDFTKNFKDRFERMRTNNKEYEYIIKEIIEYPPKVSVRVISKDDEFSPTEKDSEGYDIVNQMDAIIEANGGDIVFYEDRKTFDVYDDDEFETIEEGDSRDSIYHNCRWYYKVSSESCTGLINNGNYGSYDRYDNNGRYNIGNDNYMSGNMNFGYNNAMTTQSTSRPQSMTFRNGLTNYQSNEYDYSSSKYNYDPYENRSPYGSTSYAYVSGSYSGENKKDALEACKKAAKEFCLNNGYRELFEDNCTAFRIFKMTENQSSSSTFSIRYNDTIPMLGSSGEMTKTVESTFVPTCTNEDLSPGCSIKCVES